MADKKSGVPASAINRYNKVFKNEGWFNVSLEKDGIELRYKVKPRLSLQEFGETVMQIANTCFNNGEYRAWIRDYAMRYAIVNAYTNIELGDDTNGNYSFLMNTDIFESVVSYLDSDQFDALITAVDEQIDALADQYNSARKRELDEAITMIRSVQQKYNNVMVMLNEIAGDEIRGLAKQLQDSARDVTDEVAVIREAQAKAEASKGE